MTDASPRARKVASIDDRTRTLLASVAAGESPSKADSDALKKRKLLNLETWLTYKLAKGPKFALQKVKAATDIDREMLASGAWKTLEFKVGGEMGRRPLLQAMPGSGLLLLLASLTSIGRCWRRMEDAGAQGGWGGAHLVQRRLARGPLLLHASLTSTSGVGRVENISSGSA